MLQMAKCFSRHGQKLTSGQERTHGGHRHMHLFPKDWELTLVYAWELGKPLSWVVVDYMYFSLISILLMTLPYWSLNILNKVNLPGIFVRVTNQNLVPEFPMQLLCHSNGQKTATEDFILRRLFLVIASHELLVRLWACVSRRAGSQQAIPQDHILGVSFWWPRNDTCCMLIQGPQKFDPWLLNPTRLKHCALGSMK